MSLSAQSQGYFLRSSRLLILTGALAMVLFFWPARSLRSSNFVLYLPGTHQVIPLQEIDHARYLPLIQVLNAVGKVSALHEKRDSLKIWFGKDVLEVHPDEKKVRLNSLSLALPHPVRQTQGQWEVPVDFLTSALPQLIHQRVEYQVGTNRVFIGETKPNSFTVRLDRLSNGTRLTLQFTDKLTVRTAAQGGKWVLFLEDEPVEPIEQNFRFQDTYLSSLEFNDEDGVPKLIVTPATTDLNFYPALAEGGKVLVADLLKPPSSAAKQPGALAEPTAQSPSNSATTGPPSAGTGQQTSNETAGGPPLPVVVLDAGHGGDDKGGQSRDGILEKNLVAQLAGVWP